MIQKTITPVLILLVSTIASAKQLPISFGNNITATTHVLDKGGCSIGLQAAGCGLSEKTSLMTSPWLLADYNMYSAFMRYRYKQTEQRTEALQIALFKTFGKDYEYDMFALWVDWIRGYHLTEHYSLFLNVQFANYFVEDRPFSLRRPRIWGTSTELTISTLHEVQLVNGFYVQAELGILGVVRKYPLLLTTAAFQWRSKRWLLQFGFSMTSTIPALFSQQKRFDTEIFLANGSDHKVEGFDDFVKYDFSIHPEMVFQYFF